MRRPLRSVACLLVLGYPVALLAALAALRLVGESAWVTAAALYAPRLVALLPWLPLAALALWARLGRAAWGALGVALYVGIFPLMGLCLGPLVTREPRAEPLTVLSWNVASCAAGADRVAAAIRDERVDLAVLQELFSNGAELERELRAVFPHVVLSTQFIVASRYPLREVTEPARIPYFGALRSPRALRLVVDAPGGPLALYDVHPQSPRHGLAGLRGEGLRRELTSGRLLRGERGAILQENTWLRVLQVEAFARDAAREALPVLIAGDTNLPGASPLLARALGRWTDAFSEVGRGFGYTYPAERPFLRLDRVLHGPGLRAVSAEVRCRGLSDHLCLRVALDRG